MFKGIKSIFFDFDGVILDSVDSKSAAFEGLYKKYGKEISSKVREFHIKNGGISRFEKFKYWHKEYLGIELDDKGINELANSFSVLVFNKVVNSSKIHGIDKFLEKNFGKYGYWLITGTPTNEIHRILKKINYLKFFKGIFGSPKSKFYWIEKLINENNLNRNEILFIGDSITDHKAASFSQIKFALINHKYNFKTFEKVDVFKFDSFDQLQLKLDE